MAFRKLTVAEVSAINYTVFNGMLAILPTLDADEIDDFPLADLRYRDLFGDPDYSKELAARKLRKVYEVSGYLISDPSDYLVNPDDRTMLDLAKFVQRRHVAKFPAPIGNA